jgi:hypothetical protein
VYWIFCCISSCDGLLGMSTPRFDTTARPLSNAAIPSDERASDDK